MTDNYNPHAQGSDTMPSSDCDPAVAKDAAKDVQTAREAIRLHKIVNSLAKKGHK